MRTSNLITLVSLVVFCGCTRNAEPDRQPSPRPVSVITLAESDPTPSLAVTGTVGSWKIEDIGFEVTGRVQYVIEPETNVAGPADEQKGALLAQIDPARYETTVASANAKITMLTRQKAAAVIERDQVVPAQREAAVAAKELHQADYDRTETLFKRNAAPKADLDRDAALLKSSTAEVSRLEATREAKAAEVTSIDAQIEQAKAELQDAQRDLDDCQLYAPFRGQIAEVHVIPGGSVQRGEPVLTLQMMDPIKIDFEVSAERVRQMRYKDTLDIILPRPDGTTVRQEGAIWNTGSAADPSTRTFTITVLMRNRLVPATVPEGVHADSLTKTRDIWKFVQGILDDTDAYYVEQHAIHKDDQGEYVWKIIDPSDGSETSRGPLLKVEKIRVTAGNQLVNFLNLWKFQDLAVPEGEAFDPERDLVLGKLEFPQGQTELSGDTVLFEREQWQLRPGDLVGVDLSDNRMPSGFYVPMDAIGEKSGRHYVFAVDGSGGAAKVRKIDVSVSAGPSTRKRIESLGDQSLSSGMQIILGGVHYLTDGEAVNIASVVEVN